MSTSFKFTLSIKIYNAISTIKIITYSVYIIFLDRIDGFIFYFYTINYLIKAL